MHIASFIKVIYWIQILLKKKNILYCFSNKVTFWFLGFIQTNSLNIDLFTNEN